MTNEEIDALTLRVYRGRLDGEHPGDADRMVARDKDGGRKQATRSLSYRPVVVETLVQLGLHERFVPGHYDRKAKVADVDLAQAEKAVLATMDPVPEPPKKRTKAEKVREYAQAYGMPAKEAEKLPKPRAKARKAS
jgi:hypothetical protein